MLRFPKGPMQFEGYLAQIRHDVTTLGLRLTGIMVERKMIGRMMAVHLGEATAGDIL